MQNTGLLAYCEDGVLIETNLRDPILVNTIGHSAGLLLFGVIILLLIRDRRAHGLHPATLSIVAAALAFLWNIGSLVALGSTRSDSVLIGTVMTASFSVLSLLPAVLFQVAIRGENRAMTNAGFGVSVLAILLHVSEPFSANGALHQIALIVIAAGFAVLTTTALLVRRKHASAQGGEAVEWISLAALTLFTSSFLHFGYRHSHSPWAAEIAWHHIGIPVALVVLLQDYRFLLLDTFVRFLINSGIAAAYVATILSLNQRFGIWKIVSSSMFFTGILLVTLCLSLILFAHIRNVLQRSIGRVVFRRNDLEKCIHRITLLSAATRSEEELLAKAAWEVAQHLGAVRSAVVADSKRDPTSSQPAVLFGAYDLTDDAESAWAEAQTPLRFSSGEVRFLLTGSRRGRQRYLSEDLEDMRRLGSVIVEQVERFRSEELRRLATKAELKALQAQINPHFLFNALNTLYGSIDRSSFEARQTVLNLSEIFRYLLQGDRPFIPLSEELRIVQAYLDIEALRLGNRLETELDVSESAKAVMIPILSIQPLVENAVKHGVATRQEGGSVTLRAYAVEGILTVRIEDTGVGFAVSKNGSGEGTGLGLDNVRRRLTLAYGPTATLDIRSSDRGSTVSFQIPIASGMRSTPHELPVGA